MKKILYILAIYIFVFSSSHSTYSKAPNKKFTVLQINDVYLIQTKPDEQGGLARIKTLKDKYLQENPNLLLLLPGDFLSPSVASSVFKGQQMIDVLNSSGVDIATLGNHEFDFGAETLKQRMKEAKWEWVVSNVIDEQTGQLIGGAKPYLIKDYGNYKVGFIGLCLRGDEIAKEDLKGIKILDPFDTAEIYIPVLLNKDVDYIIALTHQNYSDDRLLAEYFPEIDLIVGGHEHFPINGQINKTLISKAGSNAKFLAKIDLYKTINKNTEKRYQLISVDKSIAINPIVQSVAENYEKQLDQKLDIEIANISESYDAISANVRSKQTNLGSLITLGMKNYTKSDLAILNGGAIRGDKFYGPGKLTKKDIITMHPFDDVVVQIELTGKQIIKVLNHGVEKVIEKAGRYPQVSSINFDLVINDGIGKVTNVKINGAKINLKQTYKVAVTNYMLQGGDGYEILKEGKLLINEDQGQLLVSIIENAFIDLGLKLRR